MSGTGRLQRVGAQGAAARREPHPALWFVLVLPYGVHAGFVRIGLTFLATRDGLSIAEGGLIIGAHMLAQWLKWLWAPAVDLLLTPRHWYRLAAVASAASLLAAAAWRLQPGTLLPLLGVIALGGVANSVLGMAVEVLMASCTARDGRGRAGAWFQAGHFGGMGVGGGLGLLLLDHLPAPWMAGGVMAMVVLTATAALTWAPRDGPPVKPAAAGGPLSALLREVRAMLATRSGRRVALLSFLPIGMGSAFGVLAQAKVAGHWGAGATQVALVQGVAAGLLAIGGCFAGGGLCKAVTPTRAYLAVGALLSVVSLCMAAAPLTVTTYVVGSLSYAFVSAMAYAAFTAVALEAIGSTALATKYNLLAALGNFAAWWSGVGLAAVADGRNASAMLVIDAALGLAGILVFGLVSRRLGRGER